MLNPLWQPISILDDLISPASLCVCVLFKLFRIFLIHHSLQIWLLDVAGLFPNNTSYPLFSNNK